VHDVFTGVVVIGDSGTLEDVVRTGVRLLPIAMDDIQWYVGTGEPEGKAGAYAIQGIGAKFVEKFEGDFDNVVGLPLQATEKLFRLKEWSFLKTPQGL
jgi:septum formation protein